jgi:peptidyl-tRNA hydrolase
VKKIKMLVHKNLNMSERKVAAQCVHAGIQLYKKDPQDHWSCVVLEASTKKFFEAVKAHVNDTSGYVVTDAGFTEVPAGSKTVVAWYEEEDGKEGE